MMYKIRKGVLLEQVADAYLIITSDEARPPCPYIRQVNATFAFYWRLLEKAFTYEQMLQEAEKAFDAPPDKLENDLQQLLQTLVTLGYLIRTQE